MGYAGRYVGKYSGSLAGKPFARTLNYHRYDSGIGVPDRAVIINAMIDLLMRLHKANGGYLEAVEGSTTVARGVGDLEACGAIEDQMRGRAPGVIIATGDMNFETAGHIDRWKSPLRIHVYFYADHMRDRFFDGRAAVDVVSLADGTADPGVFAALHHARMVLIGQRPGGPSGQNGPLKPLTERRIDDDGEKEIWEQIYICDVGHQINLKRDVTLELLQINTYSRLAEQAPTDDTIVSAETKVWPP